MAIETVEFQVDPSSVRRAVAQMNAAVEGFEKTAVGVNERVGASVERQAVMIDKHRSAWEGITRGVQRYGEDVERVGRGMGSATRGVLEFGAAVGLATKALMAHATATTVFESAVNRVRVARVALAGYVEGIGGAAVVGMEIGAVVAIERAAQWTLQKSREIQQNAIASMKSGLSYQNTETLNFVASRAGVSSDFFNGAVKSTGSVEALGQKLKDLAAIRDPILRTEQAFAAFGPDGEKMLSQLGDRFDDNRERVARWGLQLDEESRTHIDQFRRDISSLEGVFHGSEDAISAWASSVKLRVVDAFSGIYQGLRNLTGDLASVGSPELKIFQRFAGAISPDTLDMGAITKRITGTMAGNMAADQSLLTLNTLGATGRKYFAADQSENVEGLRSRVSALESQLFVSDRTSPRFGQLVGGATFPGGYPAQARALEQFVTGKERLDVIKRESDAKKEQEELEKRIASAESASASIVQSAQLAELSGLQRLNAERDIQIKQYGLSAKALDDINAAFKIRRDLEQDSLERGYFADARRNADASAREQSSILDARNRYTTTSITETAGLYGKAAGTRGEIDVQAAGFSRDSQLRALEAIDAKSVQEKVFVEQRKYQIEAEYVGKVRELEESGIAHNYDKQIADLKVLVDTKLLSEKLYQNQVKALRENEALDLVKFNAQMDEQINSAREKAAAESAKVQIDSIKGPAEGLFHTLFSDPSKFGSQFSSTLKNAFLKPIEDGLAGITARALQPIIFGADGQSGIAGMFRGLFGGKEQNPLVPLHVETNWRLAAIEALLAAPLGVAAPSAPAGVGGGAAPSVSIPGTGGGSRSYGVGQMLGPLLAASTLMYGGGASGAPYQAPGPSYQMGAGYGTGGNIYSDMAGVVGGPGGTGGFAGPLGGSAGRGIGGFSFPGGGTASRGFHLPSLSGLKGSLGIGTADLGGTPGVDGAPGVDLGSGTTFSSVAGSPVAGAAGLMAAQWGLLGGGKGTWGGIAGGTAGGALIGFQFGGPLGAAIGAAAGFGIGLGEKIAGIEPQWKEAERLVKQDYGVVINHQTADQIVSLANSKYGSRVSIAVRAPEVRQMLGLYAAGTGQKMALSATTPYGGGLSEQAGKLYQQEVYRYGSAYSYGGSLPTLGGPVSGILPSPGGSGPTYVSVNVDGKGLAPFMTGEYVTSDFVQSQYSSAINSSNGRTSNAAALTQANLITG